MGAAMPVRDGRARFEPEEVSVAVGPAQLTVCRIEAMNAGNAERSQL